MTKDNNTSVNQEELVQMSRKINTGLEKIMRFERNLHHYSKESLILLIVLTVDPGQFDSINNILASLEQLLERKK